MCEAALPEAAFDLVHARYVLIHLPHADRALERMLSALKPGGYLVLEEPDFSAAHAEAGPAEFRSSFAAVQRAIAHMFASRSMNHAFGASLARRLGQAGVVDVRVDDQRGAHPGGSALAWMMALSTRQLADQYLRTGEVSAAQLRAYEGYARDPACSAVHYASVAAWGRKPHN